MKILFLTQTTEQGPASRVRGYEMAAHLRKLGCEVDISFGIGNRAYNRVYSNTNSLTKSLFYTKALFKRLAHFKQFKNYDLVYIQKEIFPHFRPLIETILNKKNIPFVFDFDDALHKRSHRPNQIPKILKLSSGATVGNTYLNDYAVQYQPNTLLLPTCVELPDMTEKPDKKEGTLTLGWIGSSSSWHHLLKIWPTLEKLLYKETNLYLVLMADKMPGVNFNKEKVAFIPWEKSKENDFFNLIDIGLAPLTDSEWSQGKCGYKVLQYLSYGLPVVASPVGVQKILIQDKLNGLLAKEPAEWEEKIEFLIEHPEEGDVFGFNGKELVKNKYTYSIQAPRLLEFFQKIIHEKN